MVVERSPGFKLLMVIAIAVVLLIPLLMTYALVYDRKSQSETAQQSIAAGWGGVQTIVGPVLVVPYEVENVETVTENGVEKTRTVRATRELFLSPETNSIQTELKPQRLKKSIYESVLYDAVQRGTAHFALPADFDRYGIRRDSLRLGNAELRFGVSDARGLQADAKVSIGEKTLQLQPGKGLSASGGSGFFTFIEWDGVAALEVTYSYVIRGNRTLTLVPRAGQTEWNVTSSWPNPSFSGDFLPRARDVTQAGFTSRHIVSNLALGQALVLTADPAAPQFSDDATLVRPAMVPGTSSTASIGLLEPINLYSQVDRSVKYGFLFIGFTFLAFLMFDLIAGARVAAAEYLLTGAGLVLFFALLLAFAEVIGFFGAYLVAALAITGLLTSYSAAVLKSWRRAQAIGGLLVGLYATLYLLLSLEAYSLLIGSVLLFVALAVVMWGTRRIDWTARRTSAEGRA